MGPITVLVADDSSTVRTMVRVTLAKAGLTVLECSDGAEAIDVVRQNVPALAILDIEMPRLDGYGVCDQLKQMGPPWSEIPIVFLTSKTCHALEMLGEQLGAYVHKSASSVQLLQVVEGLIAEKHGIPL